MVNWVWNIGMPVFNFMCCYFELLSLRVSLTWNMEYFIVCKKRDSGKLGPRIRLGNADFLQKTFYFKKAALTLPWTPEKAVKGWRQGWWLKASDLFIFFLLEANFLCMAWDRDFTCLIIERRAVVIFSRDVQGYTHLS